MSGGARTMQAIAIDFNRESATEIRVDHPTGLFGSSFRTNQLGKHGMTPLLAYAERGDTRMCATLMRAGAHINHQNDDGDSALHLCLRAGKVDVAKILLASRADPSARNVKGDTPIVLAFAGMLQDDADLINSMMRVGGNPDSCSSQGRPLLHLAAQQNKHFMMRSLIEAGANLEAQDGKSNTALITAASVYAPDALLLLIDSGADISVKNPLGMGLYKLLESGKLYSADDILRARLASAAMMEHGTQHKTKVLGKITIRKPH